jgi:hypothetical protein
MTEETRGRPIVTEDDFSDDGPYSGEFVANKCGERARGRKLSYLKRMIARWGSVILPRPLFGDVVTRELARPPAAAESTRQ